MYNIKTLLAAASMAMATAAGLSSADAAPWNHRIVVRPERPTVARERVVDTLRLHHFRAVADPVFVRGHYVVRSHDRFGRIVFVEVNPHSGAFMGLFRA